MGRCTDKRSTYKFISLGNDPVFTIYKESKLLPKSNCFTLGHTLPFKKFIEICFWLLEILFNKNHYTHRSKLGAYSTRVPVAPPDYQPASCQKQGLRDNDVATATCADNFLSPRRFTFYGTKQHKKRSVLELRGTDTVCWRKRTSDLHAGFYQARDWHSCCFAVMSHCVYTV